MKTFRAKVPAAFSLIELLVVIFVIGVLSGLLLPVLAQSRTSAQSAQCISNLRQLAQANELYWNDNNGQCFSYNFGLTNYGADYWFGWIGPGAEGQRAYDLAQGALFPYLNGSDVRECPVLANTLTQFKLKATNLVFSYGYNFYLSAPYGKQATNSTSLRRPSQTILFADAAQINNFQSPASPSNPLVEEWYYLDLETNYSSSGNYPNGHFRHTQKANVAFADGHVTAEMPVPGSIDQRLPKQWVGQLSPALLALP